MCLVLGVLWLAGCATAPKVNWNSRVGHYTFDQAVLELGPPDKSAKLQDGTLVTEWLTRRGLRHSTVHAMSGFWVQQYDAPASPDYFLRLTFGPDGVLQAWKRVIK